MNSEGYIRYNDSADIKNSDVLYPVGGVNTHIELFSNGRLVFEGKYSIYEYFSDKISVKTGKKVFCISGTRLRLKNVSVEAFTVIGNINSIEFE